MAWEEPRPRSTRDRRPAGRRAARAARGWACAAAALAFAAMPAGAAEKNAYLVEKGPCAVMVKTPEGKPIVRYVTAKPPADESQTSVPCVGYLHPIYTPSGQVLTESRPGDHSWLRGAFLAWPQAAGDKPAGFWTCGQAVWKEKGCIVNRQCAVEPGEKAGRLSALNAWTDGETDLIKEHLELAAFAEGGVHVIDLTIRLEAAGGPVTLKPWAFAGFTFHGRRAPGESVALRGPEGEAKRPNCGWNDAKTNWPDAPWYAVGLAAKDGASCGLAIVNPKDNPKTTWHVNRGLRFLNPNVTADAPRLLDTGRGLALRYRLVAYDGQLPVDRINRLAEAFAKQ